MKNNEEIVPPWVQYPNKPPWWAGWRQGNSEGWLMMIWLPFWKKLSEEERLAYIEKWKPLPEWQEYLTTYW